MDQSAIIRKILKKAGNENLINELTARLSQSELSSLLMALAKEMTNNNTPGDLLNKYAANRFAKPSKLNPIEVKKVEIAMLEMAAASGFSPLLLSPASLLGSCSVIAKVDQNNVISGTRGLELLPDSTNMLAIYLADGLKNKTLDNTSAPVHLSATCRVTRGQLFRGDNFVPHFSLFSLVSSGKDTGSYGFEKAALARQVEFYLSYFGGRLGQAIEIKLNARGGYPDGGGFIDRLCSHLRGLYPGVTLTVNPEASDNSYYQGVNFKIVVKQVPIVDGGFVDWTQKLLGNKKERLLISGAGIDLQLLTGMLA